MVDKLSNNSGGKHPTAARIFEDIIAELGLRHIQVKTHPPYVALLDTTYWHVIDCQLIDNLCGKKKSSPIT